MGSLAVMLSFIIAIFCWINVIFLN
ncbi:hypothetical protein [Parashewanella curva]